MNVASRRPSPAVPVPHGLWSLWEMLKVNSGAFLDVFHWISRIEGVHVGVQGPKDNEERLKWNIGERHPELAASMLDGCAKLIGELETLGARVTRISVLRLQYKLKEKDITYAELGERCSDITSRLQDELSDVVLLTLNAAERALFEPKEPLFGVDFEKKFPTAVFELDEAAKSMAFGRSTASVFHFMRILEIAIRAVARSLQIPDPTKPAERNWGVILRAIWDGIETKWPTTASRMHGDGQVFEALYASLDAVKNPWRNATMHVESKYTGEEAEHIFAAVRGFMKSLASRMDENGEPKA